MKRPSYFILLACISVLGFNCQKGLSYDLPVTPDPIHTNPVTAALQGNILDEDGLPAAGVVVKVGNKTALTNAKGCFRIDKAALDKYASVVTAEKAGYFKAYRSFNATSGVNQVMIQLIKRTLTGTVNTGAGGAIALANGGAVNFPANSIVKASGGAYNGTMNVYAAYIDPTDAAISRRVPGSFLATDKDNNRVVLASYGMMAVELESASGEKLQIASGHTATLTTPIPVSLQASAPAAISLWFVDEQTGIWKEEGIAVKNGDKYAGEVKHFTYWNCDIQTPTVNVTATFKNTAGLPLTSAEVRFRPVGSYFSAHGFTDSLGQISGPVPANMNLILEVMSPCYTVMYSQNAGPFSADVNLGTITVDNNPSLVTVKGKLVNCSGNPVTNGFATITYGNMVRHVSTDAAGAFESVFYSCAGMPSACEVVGTDVAAQQQSDVINNTVVSPVTDAGTISACGTSSLQFINYNIDGTSYSVSSLTAGDNMSAFYMDSLSIKSVSINSYHANTPALAFRFENNTGTGGTIVFLAIGSVFTTSFPAPFSAALSSNAATSGAYYEGSFTGQFKDTAGTLHDITCSFRVRRQ